MYQSIRYLTIYLTKWMNYERREREREGENEGDRDIENAIFQVTSGTNGQANRIGINLITSLMTS